MARRWVFLVLSVLVLLAAAESVSADEAGIFGKKVDETKEETKEQAAQKTDATKNWAQWASEKIPSVFGSANKQASEAAGEAQSTGQAYAQQGQQSTAGFAKKWSSWARDAVGKSYLGKFYDPAKNQATRAAEVVADQTKSKEEEL